MRHGLGRHRDIDHPLILGLMLLIGLVASAAPADAQRLERFSLSWDTRYDNVDAGVVEDRVQGSVRLGLTVDLWSALDVVGFASTGGKYTSRWTDLYDFIIDDTGADFSLYFRRLYFERGWSWGRAQLGAIPPIKNIASGTGLNASGWVDGGRLEVYLGPVTLEWVAGGITDLDTPDLFSRDKNFNFVEFETTWDVTEDVTVEATGEWLADEVYLRSEARVDLPLPGGQALRAQGELIGNLDRRELAFDVALVFDPVEWIWGVEDRLGVQLHYRYLDPELGLRGTLVDDFFVYGHAFTVELKGHILEDGVLHWFSRNIFAEQPRFLVGLGLRFRG